MSETDVREQVYAVIDDLFAAWDDHAKSVDDKINRMDLAIGDMMKIVRAEANDRALIPYPYEVPSARADP